MNLISMAKKLLALIRQRLNVTTCQRKPFARECRAPRNQGNRNRMIQEGNAQVDTSTTHAVGLQDGIGEGFHAVPPPYTGNYMPPRPDLSFAGLDESIFVSAVRKTTPSVPETETSTSKTSKDIAEKPKTVRPSTPIIEEWDTNSDNDSVFRPKPKFTKINFVKSGENVKSINKENTHMQVEYPRKSQSPRDNRRN
ncbi:hypothetical protein Tco_1212589 [Tanacetum coccineum]